MDEMERALRRPAATRMLVIGIAVSLFGVAGVGFGAIAGNLRLVVIGIAGLGSGAVQIVRAARHRRGDDG